MLLPVVFATAFWLASISITLAENWPLLPTPVTVHVTAARFVYTQVTGRLLLVETPVQVMPAKGTLTVVVMLAVLPTLSLPVKVYT